MAEQGGSDIEAGRENGWETGWKTGEDGARWEGHAMRNGGIVLLAARVWHAGDPAAILAELEADLRRPEGWTAPDAGRFRPGLHLRLECDGELLMVLDMNLDRSMSLEKFARTVPAPEYVTGLLEQAIPGEFDRVGGGPRSSLIMRDPEPEGNAGMSGWPMTPGAERMERAERTLLEEIERGIPGLSAGGDAEAMRETLMTGIFERMAASALKERAASAASPMGVALILGWEADSPSSMGLVLARHLDEAGMSMSQIAISRLLRNPDWMGACRLLSLAVGTRAVVSESRELPGRPGLVMLTTDHHLELEPHAFPAPEEGSSEAHMLRQLLEWHGVRETLWVPSAERRSPGG